MSDIKYAAKGRSSSDGELIDVDDNFRNEDDWGTDERTFTLPRSSTTSSSRASKKKFKYEKETQYYRNNEEKHLIENVKSKKKGFPKPSMKSMGNLMHKIMSSITITGGGTGNPFVTSSSRSHNLNRHRRTSISASTTDIRSHNSRNDISRITKSTPGVTGLRNHGNTCFMNAVLQCICHTDILAEYFVMDQYKIDLTRRNKKNSKKFGTRGEVTEQLALLLKSLWSCQYTPEISNQFKTIVGKYESQYLGSNQHDAQEFLLWLLDKVHEDLNTATKKKYKKIKGSQGRPEEAVAAEALSNHMRCNNSFVHDLFRALYRSSLTCPKCQSRSITFDPFLCVSIPIPQRQMRPVFITVVYFNQQPKQVRLGLSINSQANIRELKEVLAADSAISEDKIVITELVPEGFHHTFSDSQPVSLIHENDNIFAIEVPTPRPVNARDGEYLLIVWINRLGTGCQGKRFGCPYVKEVPREVTFEELEVAILSTMSGILKEGVVEQVKHGPIVRFRVVDGIPGKCYLPFDVDHPLYMPTVDKALSLCDEERGPRHLKLIVEWDLETRKEMILNIDDVIEEHSSVNQLKNQQTQAATATLSECFELYTQEEMLGPENPWMCPSCKQLRQGVKRLGLWTVPDILVIHLKRFRQTSTQRTKLNTLVEFPAVGLDMSSHIVGRNFNNNLHTNGYSTLNYWSPWRRHRSRYTRNDDYLYDLYAVCNHHGNMQGGHYTAYCKNPTDGNWYSFDDTKVEQLKNEADVVSPHAYILFYQKSTLTNSSASSSVSSSSSSGSSDHWAYRMPSFNYAPPKFSKSQDNLVGLKDSGDDEFRNNSRKPSPFTRGLRPYCSMAPIGSHQKKTEAVIAEPDHYSDDDEQYNKVCITESCV